MAIINNAIPIKPAPNAAKYDGWIKRKLNVMFRGKKGIGKSEKVIAAFNRNYGEGNWLYFSASTMDPWLDFIGAPKEAIDEETGKSYLKMIRPAALEFGTIKAIMFDEYNRAPTKIRNAVMELMQFKSINGHKFEHLETIWAAINPHDDAGTYNVEYIDPAEEDRFQVIVDLPYDVDPDWFRTAYGNEGYAAAMWWRKQSDEIKDEISPRRLNYAVKEYLEEGDLYDILPPRANIVDLISHMNDGSYKQRLSQLYALNNEADVIHAFSNHNFFNGTKELIVANDNYLEYFIPYVPKDEIVNFYLSEQRVRKAMSSMNYNDYQYWFDPIINSENTKLVTGIKTGIERWRSRFVGPEGYTDIEYIDMVANSQKNFAFISEPDKRRDLINQFGKILNSTIVLKEETYRKMLGVMLEVLHHVKDDKSYRHAVVTNIKNIKRVYDTQGYGRIEGIVNTSLPGLRYIKSSSIFEGVLEILEKEKIFKREDYAAD